MTDEEHNAYMRKAKRRLLWTKCKIWIIQIGFPIIAFGNIAGLIIQLINIFK